MSSQIRDFVDISVTFGNTKNPEVCQVGKFGYASK